MKTFATSLMTQLISFVMLVFLALPSGTIAAQGPFSYEPELTRDELGTPFTGYGALCGVLDAGVYTVKTNGEKLRNAELLQRVETNSSIYTGWQTQTMSFNINYKTGKGKSWGSIILEPDAYTGTLEEDYVVYMRDGVWDTSGTYVGTADLAGVEVDYISTNIADPAEWPEEVLDYCGSTPVMGVYFLEGNIYEK